MAASFTSMLKTSGSIKSATQPGKGVVEIGGYNRAGRDKSKVDRSELDGGEVENNEVGKKVQKMSKSKNLFKFKKTVESLDFLISRAKLAFTKLK